MMFKNFLKANSVVTKLNNLNVGIIGDSISTTSYGGVNSSNYWIGLCETAFSWNTKISAVSGTPIAEKTGFNSFVSDTRWQSLNDTFTPDLILIFGGTNDFGARDVPIGLNTDDPITNKDTFYGGCKYLVESIKSDNPTSKVFMMLPIHRANDGNPAYNGDTDAYLTEYVDAIKYVCNENSIDYIDLFSLSGLTYENMVSGGVYSPDGLHPNSLGHQKIFNTLKNELILKY